MTNNPSINISSEEVSEKFSAKMAEIELHKKEILAQNKAIQLGYKYISLRGFPIQIDVLEIIPEDKAKELKVIPIFKSGKLIKLASLDPVNPNLQQYLEDLTKEHPGQYELYLISEHSFEIGIKNYDRIPKRSVAVSGVSITAEDITKYQANTDPDNLKAILDQANTTEIVTIIIAGALKRNASDIHIEAEEKDIIVRYRIDGSLYVVADLKKDTWPKIISRLKLLSHLKINITNQPQDGRFTIFLQSDKIEVRVSTIPTAYGESVVMRLLKSSATGLAFDDLGIRGVAYQDLKNQVERPNGMVITTGPTGSGKTTTLYAILNKLNQTDTKIITLEDPVEYKLHGINQSQIDHAAGYDFAKGLKSILRQDPDVVMVGEIRDFETADIAINAALTGHLVLSTIHTNSAAGAIPRFLAMGVKPFLLAPALNCVMAQRLVRKICTGCKQEDNLDKEKIEKIKKILSTLSPKSGYKVDINNLKFYKGTGCQACGNLGYKGRIGIYEIMAMNEEIEKVILSGQVSEYVMQDLAIKNGMVTMAQDGLLKALDGITSVDEILSVAE